MATNDEYLKHIEYLENHGYEITRFDPINTPYLVIKKKKGGLEHRPDIGHGKAEIIVELIYLRERIAELEGIIKSQ